MTAFFKEIEPFRETETKMKRDRRWKNFWKSMILINIRILV